MGKYREAYTKFIEDTEQDRIEGNNHLDPLAVSLNILENAEDEIAQLQSEKALLEDQVKDLRSACEQKQEIINSNKKSVSALSSNFHSCLARAHDAFEDLQGKYYAVIADKSVCERDYNALVERVKAHNASHGMYLISLDTQEET